MNLRKKIVKSEKNDFEKMAGSVEAMRNVVRHFKVGTLPNDEFSLEDYREYCEHLIQIQEINGSWTVAGDPSFLSGDEVVEFITYPSYLALGALVMHDEILSGELLEGRDKALVNGFSQAKLEGYGEDSLFQTIEMVFMMIEAGIPPWLVNMRSEESFYPISIKLISLRDKLQSRLDGGDTILPFGGDYKEIFELVVAGLSVL